MTTDQVMISSSGLKTTSTVQFQAFSVVRSRIRFPSRPPFEMARSKKPGERLWPQVFERGYDQIDRLIAQGRQSLLTYAKSSAIIAP
ncbi:MAG: hypothetical protein DMF76_20880 [Acidobacteria bacterium]|nr:MAG: hypothetical protein DMF76_20880 [Acidobacteriota bacterium]